MSIFDRLKKKDAEPPHPLAPPVRRMRWEDERSDFYCRCFGGGCMVAHEMAMYGPAIHVYVYPPAEARPYSTLITSGMSEFLQVFPSDSPRPVEQRRVELFLRVPEVHLEHGSLEMPWQVDCLRFFAHLPEKSKTVIVPFKTLSNGNPPEPIVPGSVLQNVVFLPPFYEGPDLHRGLTCMDGTRISFLLVDFLTSAEILYKAQHGNEKFVSLLKQHNHPTVLNTGRASYV